MKTDMPSSAKKTSRLARLITAIAVLLILAAVGMIILMKTGFQFSSGTTTEYAELERLLKNPVNAQYVEPAKADLAEIRKLDRIRPEITGRIGSFGTNAPEDKFMQKELQRLEQTVEKRKAHLEEIKRELK